MKFFNLLPSKTKRAKSIYTERLDYIQQETDRFLKPLGFKQKGRTYNRTMSEGLVHVINFQMGAYEFSSAILPGIRESMYGRFVINLGVFLPCVHNTEHAKEIKFCKDYYCQIRQRTGILAHGKDIWLKLGRHYKKTAKTVIQEIDQYGLMFLDIFRTYDDVVRYYDDYGFIPGSNQRRSQFEVSIILFHQGNRQKAFAYLDEIINDEEGGPHHKGFIRYVKHFKLKLLQKASDESQSDAGV